MKLFLDFSKKLNIPTKFFGFVNKFCSISQVRRWEGWNVRRLEGKKVGRCEGKKIRRLEG